MANTATLTLSFCSKIMAIHIGIMLYCSVVISEFKHINWIVLTGPVICCCVSSYMCMLVIDYVAYPWKSGHIWQACVFPIANEETKSQKKNRKKKQRKHKKKNHTSRVELLFNQQYDENVVGTSLVMGDDVTSRNNTNVRSNKKKKKQKKKKKKMTEHSTRQSLDDEIQDMQTNERLNVNIISPEMANNDLSQRYDDIESYDEFMHRQSLFDPDDTFDDFWDYDYPDDYDDNYDYNYSYDSDLDFDHEHFMHLFDYEHDYGGPRIDVDTSMARLETWNHPYPSTVQMKNTPHIHHRFLDSTYCTICVEMYERDDKMCGLQCGHTFHWTCIREWFNQNTDTCPNCRKRHTSDEH